MIQSMEGQHGDKWEASMIELRQLENLKEMLIQDIKNRIPSSLRFRTSLCPSYIKYKRIPAFVNVSELSFDKKQELYKEFYTQTFNNTYVWDIIEPTYSYTLEIFKYKLRRIRECMLDLNNQPDTDNEINNNGVYEWYGKQYCPYFGSYFNEDLGCKTPVDGMPDSYSRNSNTYRKDKIHIMSFLRGLIEFVTREFAERNPKEMKHTETYVRDLYKTLEFYMFFIGSKHYAPISEFVKLVVDPLNNMITPFTGFKLIEIQQYNESRYASCRSVGMMPPLPDKQYPDKDRIIFVNQYEFPDQSEIAKEELKGGGKSKRQTRRRNTRKRK